MRGADTRPTRQWQTPATHVGMKVALGVAPRPEGHTGRRAMAVGNKAHRVMVVSHAADTRTPDSAIKQQYPGIVVDGRGKASITGSVRGWLPPNRMPANGR